MAQILQSEKRREEEVKQAPEKSSKELEIMEDIRKSLRSTPSSDDLFGMMVAAESKIYPLRRRGKSNLKSTISSIQFAFQIPRRR